MAGGRFIVFEGLDGAGSETQSKLLKGLLERGGVSHLLLDYPDYAKPIGSFINSYLHGHEHIPVEVKLILYSADFLKDKKEIEDALAEGKLVVACRFFTSTLAYQSSEGFSTDKLLEYAKLMGMPVPDLCIYLKVSPETSARRKLAENGKLDRHESDLAFLSNVAEGYDRLASENVFCEWAAIDGEKPVSDVFADVRKAAGL